MYVYESFEKGLWTVGHYRPDGKFSPESDHDNVDDARKRVWFLNGGKVEREPLLEPSLEQLAIGIMAAIIVADSPGNPDSHRAVSKAREIMDAVYKTEPE